MEEKIVEFMQGVLDFISNVFYDIIVGVIVEFIIAYKYSIIICLLLGVFLIAARYQNKKRKLTNIISKHNENNNKAINLKEVKKVHSGIFFYNYSVITCETCDFIKITVPINLMNTTNKIQPIIVNANVYVNDKKQIELSSHSFKINPADSLKTECIYDINMHTTGPSHCMLELSINNKNVVTYKFNIKKENNITVTNNM